MLCMADTWLSFLDQISHIFFILKCKLLPDHEPYLYAEEYTKQTIHHLRDGCGLLKLCVCNCRERKILSDLDWPFISNCILAGFLLEYEDWYRFWINCCWKIVRSQHKFFLIKGVTILAWLLLDKDYLITTF